MIKRVKAITRWWFNSILIAYIVASLDKVLYNNYLYLVASKSSKLSGKSQKNNQKTQKLTTTKHMQICRREPPSFLTPEG